MSLKRNPLENIVEHADTMLLRRPRRIKIKYKIKFVCRLQRVLSVHEMARVGKLH